MSLVDVTGKPLESGNAVLQTIHASEGGRAYKLLQERHKRLQGLEAAKNEIEKETRKRRLYGIGEKYTGSKSEALEEAFRNETVGLVTAEEFREKRKRLLEKLEEEKKAEEAQVDVEIEARVKPIVPRIQKTKLSFVLDEEEEESEQENEEKDRDSLCKPVDEPLLQKAQFSSSKERSNGEDILCEGTTDRTTVDLKPISTPPGVSVEKPKKKIWKDPTVDTSFLSDAEREERQRLHREAIIQEYYEQQKRIKDEILEVTYSYWDGLGHRRTVQIRKGASIGQFLQECRRTLEKDFPELRSVSTDNLMYIKEDLILPHQVTFYELIKNKARGKSGPLFNFDVHEDVRLYSDTRIEKDESHAGKIVDRKWYERNKHIFPASRWELYDPSKTYEKYTIHGDRDYSRTL